MAFNSPRSSLVHKTAIPTVTIADNTPQLSAIIDTRGYEYVEFITLLGALVDADATFAVTIVDGNSNVLSDAVAVPADFLEGTLASAGFTFANDNEIRRIGYRCRSRYVRYTITPTNNTGNASFGVLATLAGAKTQPIIQPAS
jgi:hypothetical protein